MKRRLFALLAVPALALGFAFSSPATDQAQAYVSVHTLCALTASRMAEAEYYGNVQGYIYYADIAEGLGCIADL